MKEKLSLSAARRLAIAAQGLARAPTGGAGMRQAMAAIDRIGLLQIDSVSAVVRAHYMPLFSRLGAYPRDLVDRAASRRPRRLVEYWAHEASYLPVSTWPLMRWRMAKARRNEGIYRGLAKFADERRDFLDDVLRLVRDRGAMAASDIEGEKGSGGWWGWSAAKHAFEWHFWAGNLTTSHRRGFERVYDLPEKVLPDGMAVRAAPDEADAIRDLLRISIRALGVATAADLRDYFRLSPGEADARIAELVESGEILPVRVEGWSQKAFLDPAARIPRKLEAAAILAPFDPLVWERNRAERLFDFRYRLEIYTPAEKRVHGYYVMPFLLGDRIVARFDLRADRAGKTLRVVAAHAEPCAPPHAAEAARAELAKLADWLDLDIVTIEPKGDFAPALAGATA